MHNYKESKLIVSHFYELGVNQKQCNQQVTQIE